MAFNEDSSASGQDEPWIQWFCGLKGHEMFCEVERSYIEDGFNLYGLRACVSNFSDCLDLILDRIGPDDSDDSHLTQSACTLYGLIHARYIITAHGLDAMYNKYAAKDFGTCPLVQCQLQNVLPVGLKDEMGADAVKLFCPKCQEVYHAPPVRSRSGTSSNSNNHNAGGGGGNNHNGGGHSNPSSAGVDGAAFGTTFPHLFLMTFSNLVPDPLPVETSYVPRVFGFRVHKSAQRQPPPPPPPQQPPPQQQQQHRAALAAAPATVVAAEAANSPMAESRTGMTVPANSSQTTKPSLNDSTMGTMAFEERTTRRTASSLSQEQEGGPKESVEQQPPPQEEETAAGAEGNRPEDGGDGNNNTTKADRGRGKRSASSSRKEEDNLNATTTTTGEAPSSKRRRLRNTASS